MVDEDLSLMNAGDSNGSDEDNDEQGEADLQNLEEPGPNRKGDGIAQADLGAAAEAQVEPVPEAGLPRSPEDGFLRGEPS
jgi:hypothetical protein